MSDEAGAQADAGWREREKGRLAHNPEPLKVVKSTLRCRKCRQWAPRCTCWNGADYEEIVTKEAEGGS